MKTKTFCYTSSTADHIVFPSENIPELHIHTAETLTENYSQTPEAYLNMFHRTHSFLHQIHIQHSQVPLPVLLPHTFQDRKYSRHRMYNPSFSGLLCRIHQ